MYETIYEINRYPYPKDLVHMGIITVVVFVFFIGAIYKFSQTVKNEGAFSRSTILKLLFVLLYGIGGVICALFLIDSIFYGGSEDYEFAKKYYQGSYEIIEGPIEDFCEKNSATTWETFRVNNINFKYGGAWKVCFYNQNRAIYKDGQEVRIAYIPYELEEDDVRNVIVKLEVKRRIKR